jgi:DNA-binding transcriptional ArsR family regulator
MLLNTSLQRLLCKGTFACMVEREILGLEAIRLLAHPLRQRIERELRKGPVSATSLAQALGESTGLTSYHLRQLAKHGFVEEVPGHGKGRERWWRFVPKDRRLPERPEQGPEMRAVLDEVMRQQFAGDLGRFAEAMERDEEGPWAGAFPFSFSSMEVTIEELRQFFEDYIALLYKYKRPEGQAPPGARIVQARFFAYPDSET